MSNKLHTLIGIVLFLSFMPIRGVSQTDEGNTVQTPPAHHAHVVKKAWNGTKQAVSTGAHATAHATGKAWHATKQGVSTAAHATAHATGKAWRGTKKAVTKGYNSTVHPHEDH